MKIVFLNVWFSDKMGYIENCLPKAMAKLGHEVHVISSTAQASFNQPNYDIIYRSYLGDPVQPEGITHIDGFTLHRIPFRTIAKKMYLKSLGRKLREIDPDIVHTFDAFSFISAQGAFYKLILGYKYFTANHIVNSVFPLFNKESSSFLHHAFFFFSRTVPGRMVSWLTSLCYPATIDALELAVKYYGVQKHKVKLACLGVDTDIFTPKPEDKDFNIMLKQRREEAGCIEGDLLCIYTGRFTDDKNPLCLAKAIDKLVEMGEPFKAIFLGDGPQLQEINSMKGCKTYKFVPYHQLAGYYHISDIGVWPTQESTSMIDATACGVPIIISNKVKATERVEGNGLTYIESDVDDLIRVLLKMKDHKLRKAFSERGVEKIKKSFSWDKIASERVADYESFLK